MVPKQTDQVEEATGVQVQDRPPARLLPTGTALRVAVCAALLLPGGRSGGRRCSTKLRLRVAATATAARAGITAADAVDNCARTLRRRT